MTTITEHTRSTPVHWEEVSRAVVVGVDGSERNKAAIAWAEYQAETTGRPLTLLAVLADYSVPIPHRSMRLDSARDWQVLNQITAEVTHSHPDLTVRTEVESGSTVSRLLDRSVEQGMLVVGKRGLGTFGRLIVGSTSIAAAGRSRVPVVVVPDGWRQPDHDRSPVVVGLHPDEANHQVLRFAFQQAQLRGVRLRVVHALDLQARLVWDQALGGAAYHHQPKPEADRVGAQVQPFRAEFPDVAVHLGEVRGNAGAVLLDEALRAQLVVVGRHQASHTGFPLGSVTRGVLHYSETPVAVVPAD